MIAGKTRPFSPIQLPPAIAKSAARGDVESVNRRATGRANQPEMAPGTGFGDRRLAGLHPSAP